MVFEEVAAFHLFSHQLPRCSVGEADNGCPQSRLFVVVVAQSVNNVNVIDVTLILARESPATAEQMSTTLSLIPS